MAQCEICGKEFVKNRAYQKYCSKECRNIAINIRRRIIKKLGYKPTRICPICGQYFTPGKRTIKYCSSECSKKARKIQGLEYKRKVRKGIEISNEKIEACKKAHNDCFDCPTTDGECLFD